jgi:hypothetical protein
MHTIVNDISKQEPFHDNPEEFLKHASKAGVL